MQPVILMTTVLYRSVKDFKKLNMKIFYEKNIQDEIYDIVNIIFLTKD